MLGPASPRTSGAGRPNRVAGTGPAAGTRTRARPAGPVLVRATGGTGDLTRVRAAGRGRALVPRAGGGTRGRIRVRRVRRVQVQAVRAGGDTRGPIRVRGVRPVQVRAGGDTRDLTRARGVRPTRALAVLLAGDTQERIQVRRVPAGGTPDLTQAWPARVPAARPGRDGCQASRIVGVRGAARPRRDLRAGTRRGTGPPGRPRRLAVPGRTVPVAGTLPGAGQPCRRDGRLAVGRPGRAGGTHRAVGRVRPRDRIPRSVVPSRWGRLVPGAVLRRPGRLGRMPLGAGRLRLAAMMCGGAARRVSPRGARLPRALVARPPSQPIRMIRDGQAGTGSSPAASSGNRKNTVADGAAVPAGAVPTGPVTTGPMRTGVRLARRPAAARRRSAVAG